MLGALRAISNYDAASTFECVLEAFLHMEAFTESSGQYDVLHKSSALEFQ